MKNTLISKELGGMRRYEISLRADGLPELSQENVSKIEAIIRLDSNYRGPMNVEAPQPGSSAYLIRELKRKPLDFCLKTEIEGGLLYKIVCAIDRENSTHINADFVGRKQLTRRLAEEYVTLGNLEFALKNPKENVYKVIELLSRNTDPTKSEDFPKGEPANPQKTYNSRNNFSFATKFCHYMAYILFEGEDEQDNYSIYDAVIDEAIRKYDLSLQKEKFNKPKDKKYATSYKKYQEAIDGIRDGKISRNGFDHLLWYYFKGKDKTKIWK